MSRTKKPTDGPSIEDTIIDGLRPLAIPVGKLSLDDENIRLHDERNIEAIAASLKKFGQRKPIVVQRDGMRVRAGNGTLTAVKRLGWTHIAAVVVDEADAEAAAFAVADNRSAELGEWDFKAFADLIEKYQFDANSVPLGFTSEELGAIMRVDAWGADETAGDEEGGEEDDSPKTIDDDKPVPSLLKIRIIDLPHRSTVQSAIEELLKRPDLKKIARIV